MQILFSTTVNDYVSADDGKSFIISSPTSCLNPDCHMPIPPKKHGGYWRYIIHSLFSGRIYIHRFYCPYCGKTFSFLPDFCIPYYRYALSVIEQVLIQFFSFGLSLNQILQLLIQQQKLSYLSIQNLSFYCRRFVSNESWISSGIRQLISSCTLPDPNTGQKEKAKKALHIIESSFLSTTDFSTRFFQQCTRSFLAPCHY